MFSMFWFLCSRIREKEVIDIVQMQLMKMEYFDSKAETHLEAYADTLVLEKEGPVSYIAAVRLGGYPESVKGMSEAIYGGGSVSVEIDGNRMTVHSRVKQYRKEFSHDGIYAEATLLIRDDEQRTGQEDEENVSQADRPRKCYLFCEQGNSDRLFEDLDKKTAVPLIPEFKEYILSELQNRGILKPLRVISCREKFDVWLLSMAEDEESVSQADRPRKCYLFCEQGNSGSLFEELDKKTAVALIPEFKEYILSE